MTIRHKKWRPGTQRTRGRQNLRAVLATGVVTVTDFPRDGDNFRTVGPWRIREGAGWLRWQLQAISAEIAAARANGDDMTARRLRRTLEARRLQGRGAQADAQETGGTVAGASTARATVRTTGADQAVGEPGPPGLSASNVTELFR